MRPRGGRMPRSATGHAPLQQPYTWLAAWPPGCAWLHCVRRMHSTSPTPRSVLPEAIAVQLTWLYCLSRMRYTSAGGIRVNVLLPATTAAAQGARGRARGEIVGRSRSGVGKAGVFYAKAYLPINPNPRPVRKLCRAHALTLSPATRRPPAYPPAHLYIYSQTDPCARRSRCARCQSTS